MTDRKPTSRLRAAGALTLGAVLLLWFPLVETFSTIGIPLLATSPLLLLGFLALVATGLALVAAATLPSEGGSRLHHVVFACAITAIVLVGIDISIGGFAVLNALTPDAGAASLRRPLRLLVLLALAGVVFMAVRALHRHAVTLLPIVGIAAFASTLVSNPAVFRQPHFTTLQYVSEPPRDLPPFVYIVLDEAMGIAGLNAAPGGVPAADQLRSLLTRHGFRIYANTFSRHFVSARSIPNAINFDFSDDTYGPILRHQQDLKVRSRLFESLADDGYEVITYGTEHIDFCFARATRCEVLPSFNPFSPLITNEALRSWSFLQIVRRAKSTSYIVYAYTSLGERMRADVLPSAFSAVDAYAFPAWFDRFAADLESSTRGRAYFAHILGPHAPYVVDRTCELTGESHVSYFLAEERGLKGESLDAERVATYEHYFDQYACVLLKLDTLLTDLARTPNFRDATIVIHGDHGARISAGQYYEHLSDRDYLDNYSALFAVRGPAIQPGEDHRRSSVQRLVAEYFSGEPFDSLGPDDHTVVVDSIESGKVVVREMPSPDNGVPAD